MTIYFDSIFMHNNRTYDKNDATMDINSKYANKIACVFCGKPLACKLK